MSCIQQTIITKQEVWNKNQNAKTLTNHPEFSTHGEMIAWLKKQYETFTKRDIDNSYLKGISDCKHQMDKQKTEQTVEIPFGAKDSELQEATYFIPEGFHVEIKDDKVVIKKCEQKPAWSKEDEDISIAIENHLREYYVEKKGYPYVANENSPEMKEYRWLKSLKCRLK